LPGLLPGRLRLGNPGLPGLDPRHGPSAIIRGRLAERVGELARVGLEGGDGLPVGDHPGGAGIDLRHRGFESSVPVQARLGLGQNGAELGLVGDVGRDGLDEALDSIEGGAEQTCRIRQDANSTGHEDLREIDPEHPPQSAPFLGIAGVKTDLSLFVTWHGSCLPFLSAGHP